VLENDGTNPYLVPVAGDARYTGDRGGQILQVGAIARDVRLVRIQVLGLDHAIAFRERLIVTGIVGHHDHGRAIESIDEQATFIVDVEIHRPAHDLPPAGSKPLSSRREQPDGDLVFLDHLEYPEKAHRLIPYFGMQFVGDGRDCADRLAAAHSAKQLDLSMFEKGVLLLVQVYLALADEWGYPIRVGLVQLEREHDERVQVSLGHDRLDTDIGSSHHSSLERDQQNQHPKCARDTLCGLRPSEMTSTGLEKAVSPFAI